MKQEDKKKIIIFKEFTKEFREKIGNRLEDKELEFQEFSNILDELVSAKGKYSEIALELEQYLSDLATALTVATTMKQTVYESIDMKAVFDELIDNPIYIGENLTPVRQMVKADLIHGFCEEKGVPTFVMVIAAERPQIAEVIENKIKEFIDSKEKEGVLGYLPTVRPQRPSQANNVH